MAKLQVLAALLGVLLAVSAVAAFRTTTITTTVVEDVENPRRQGGSCEEQVRQQDNFNHCQMFLSEHTQEGGSYDELAMVTGGENPQRGQHLKECCRQMENVQEECRCEGLKIMMSQQQRGQRQQQMQEMRREAENLPAMCNLSPRQCQFETILF